jgi:hypothetical protein
MLGLIGIYIGDLIERSKGRPPYLVQKRVGDLPGNETAKIQSLGLIIGPRRPEARAG